MSGVAGLVWGAIMLDTGGLFWAWFSHGIQDVVIFAFLVLATTAPPGLGLPLDSTPNG